MAAFDQMEELWCLVLHVTLPASHAKRTHSGTVLRATGPPFPTLPDPCTGDSPVRTLLLGVSTRAGGPQCLPYWSSRYRSKIYRTEAPPLWMEPCSYVSWCCTDNRLSSKNLYGTIIKWHAALHVCMYSCDRRMTMGASSPRFFKFTSLWLTLWRMLSPVVLLDAVSLKKWMKEERDSLQST